MISQGITAIWQEKVKGKTERSDTWSTESLWHYFEKIFLNVWIILDFSPPKSSFKPAKSATLRDKVIITRWLSLFQSFFSVWQQFDSKCYNINFRKCKPVIHGDWRKRRTIYSDERDLSRAAEWKPVIRICGRQSGIKSFVWQVWTICLFPYLACITYRREERKSGRMCKALAWSSFCTVRGLVGFQRCLGPLHFCFFFFLIYFTNILLCSLNYASLHLVSLRVNRESFVEHRIWH